MKVESKYKNPDKRIECLKEEVKRQSRLASEHYKDLVKARGECIVWWSKNTTEETDSCRGHYFAQFKPGDIIAIIGHVIEVSAKTDPSCKNESSEIKYIQKETRRIGRWY